MSDSPLPTEPEPSAPPPIAPMPWEDRARSALGRFWGTLGNAFAPMRGVPALCSPAIAPAWTFALLSALPAMLASGIVPYTRTLSFGPSLHTTPTALAAKIPLWVDVLTSMGIGGAITLIAQLSWALPFASLLSAFADARVPAALVRAIAVRFALYRAWLVPAGLFAFNLALWALPALVAAPDASGEAGLEPTTAHLLAFVFFQLVPPILILLGAQATAASLGASSLGALAVAIVPAIMQVVVGMTVSHYTSVWLPPPPDVKPL